MLLYYLYITYPHRRVTLTAKRFKLPPATNGPFTNPLTNAIWACVHTLELMRWSKTWMKEERSQASEGLSSRDIQYCLRMNDRPPQYPWLDKLRVSIIGNEEFLDTVKKLKRPAQEVWNRCNYLSRLGIFKAVHASSDEPTTRRRHGIRYRLGPKADTDLRALWRVRKRLRVAHTEDTDSNGTVTLIGLVGWTKISSDLRKRLMEQMEEIASSIAHELDSTRTPRKKRDSPLIVIDPEYEGMSLHPIWLVDQQRRLWELKKRLGKTDLELGIYTRSECEICIDKNPSLSMEKIMHGSGEQIVEPNGDVICRSVCLRTGEKSEGRRTKPDSHGMHEHEVNGKRSRHPVTRVHRGIVGYKAGRYVFKTEE